MFASLRFPDGKEYPETVLSDKILRDGIPESVPLSKEQRDAILTYLPRSCPNPEVLSYRAEFAEELASSPEMEEIFREFSALTSPFPAVSRAGGTAETDKLQTVTVFEHFAKRFDRFCKILSTAVPESTAAKRCFLFCRNYGESFEYKELKTKATELRRAFGFEYGFSLTAGNPAEEGTARLQKESVPPQGVRFTADRVIAEFGGTPLPEPETKPRPYTDVEIAVLTGMIRKDPKLARRLEEFIALYAAAGTEEVLRISREAQFFIAVNQLYKAGRAAGYSLCRPVFRKPGFYSEITGLCYPTASGGKEKADYGSSPLNHVTVVCGPDSLQYLNAVGFAHLCASAGGLVFAQEAQMAPVNCLECDQNERIRTDRINEDSLCLCGHLFDVMLPRQEEASVSEVLLRLADRNSRSVIRICSKSNLAVLQKKSDGGELPPCTLLQAGTDRTLEELLQRHKLTAEKEAGV